MIIPDSTRIRLIRALLGMSSKDFADRLGVCVASITNWERGRTAPGPVQRQELYKLCHENKLAFSPSGMPFPWPESEAFKQEAVQEQHNAGSSFERSIRQ